MSFFPGPGRRFAVQLVASFAFTASFAWTQSVVATIPATNGVEGNPMTIAVNPLTGRVYIAGSNIEVVDQKTNHIVDTITVGSGQLNGVAIDPVRRRLYVVDDAQGLFAIDLNTNAVVGNVDEANVYGVAVNPATNRVYVEAGSALQVFDGSTLAQIATVNYPLGGPQGQIAVNPATNRIYVVFNLFPGDLWVVDGSTNTSLTTITGLVPLAYGVDLDPFRNLVFVAGQFGGLSKINGATNTLISTNSNVGGQPDGVSVNPANQKVYVVDQRFNEVRVVNEQTNALEPVTVPVGTTPVNSAIDYLHGLLYVGNTDENQSHLPVPTVSVIKLQ